MDKTRERIAWPRITSLFGKVRSVTVRELFYEARPGYSGPEGWSLLDTPVTLEEAADTIATQYGLIVVKDNGKESRPDYRREELIVPRFDQDRPRTYVSGRMMLRFLDDSETPVLVEYRLGDESVTGTYGCVTAEGEMMDGTPLSDSHKEWLAKFEAEAEAWYNRKRVHS